MSLGVYIHYPYCRRRCDYCDFAISVEPLERIDHRRYGDRVLAELEVRAADFGGSDLVSIYIGGGTPSLWPAPELSRVLDAVRERFDATDGELEVTLEANPIDCQPEALEAYANAGVNRLSVGVQSFDAGELAVIGRDHGMGDGLAALETIGAQPRIRQLSVDIILGTPGSADAGLASLRRAADFEPDHLSVYELTFSDSAPLGRAASRGEITPRDGDELAELYTLAHHELVERGYEHYEISSYAREGGRAVHNSLYWTGGHYLGLGASAASYRRRSDGGAVRETNVRSAARYLAAPTQQSVASREVIEPADAEKDQLWLALRTADGIAAAALDSRPALRDWLLEGDLARLDAGRIRPTLQGFLVADQIASRVVS